MSDARELLAEALDLAVRARTIDEQVKQADMDSVYEPYGRPKSLTPHLWVLDQYDQDLADWEKRSREFLMRL